MRRLDVATSRQDHTSDHRCGRGRTPCVFPRRQCSPTTGAGCSGREARERSVRPRNRMAPEPPCAVFGRELEAQPHPGTPVSTLSSKRNSCRKCRYAQSGTSNPQSHHERRCERLEMAARRRSHCQDQHGSIRAGHRSDTACRIRRRLFSKLRSRADIASFDAHARRPGTTHGFSGGVSFVQTVVR